LENLYIHHHPLQIIEHQCTPQPPLLAPPKHFTPYIFNFTHGEGTSDVQSGPKRSSVLATRRKTKCCHYKAENIHYFQSREFSEGIKLVSSFPFKPETSLSAAIGI